MDGGRWTVDGGRWTVDGGRWTVDGGWRAAGGGGLTSVSGPVTKACPPFHWPKARLHCDETGVSSGVGRTTAAVDNFKPRSRWGRSPLQQTTPVHLYTIHNTHTHTTNGNSHWRIGITLPAMKYSRSFQECLRRTGKDRCAGIFTLSFYIGSRLFCIGLQCCKLCSYHLIYVCLSYSVVV